MEKFAQKQEQVGDHTDDENEEDEENDEGKDGDDDDDDDDDDDIGGEGEQDGHYNSNNNAQEAAAAASVCSASEPVEELPQQSTDNAGYEWSVNISSESEDDAPAKGFSHVTRCSLCSERLTILMFMYGVLQQGWKVLSRIRHLWKLSLVLMGCCADLPVCFSALTLLLAFLKGIHTIRSGFSTAN